MAEPDRMRLIKGVSLKEHGAEIRAYKHERAG